MRHTRTGLKSSSFRSLASSFLTSSTSPASTASWSGLRGTVDETSETSVTRGCVIARVLLYIWVGKNEIGASCSMRNTPLGRRFGVPLTKRRSPHRRRRRCRTWCAVGRKGVAKDSLRRRASSRRVLVYVYRQEALLLGLSLNVVFV